MNVFRLYKIFSLKTFLTKFDLQDFFLESWTPTIEILPEPKLKFIIKHLKIDIKN